MTSGRARARQRERVDEVGERGAEAAEQPRHRERHARDLAPGGQLDRLDPVGDELGPARDRRQPQVGRRGGGELAQQRADVGLVARALAAEDVGVDHDERLAHAAASRYTATVSRATLPQSKARARAMPSGRSSSRRSIASLRPGGDRVRVERVDQHGRAARHLLQRAVAGGDDRRAAGHRLEHREPEALVERDVGDCTRAAVEPRELVVLHLPEPADAVARDSDAAPARRAGDQQRQAVQAGAPVGLDEPRQVLARLEGRDRQHVVAGGRLAFGRERQARPRSGSRAASRRERRAAPAARAW